MVTEMVNRYNTSDPSIAYCYEKLDNIASGAYTVAFTLGAQQ
jgi:hypothetical protein